MSEVMAEAAEAVLYHGGPIFDGDRLHHAGHAVLVAGGHVVALGAEEELRAQARSQAAAPVRQVDLCGDILSPGYVDLQLNGGGGVMLGDAPDVDTLRRMAAAHRSLGATHILPTLITATPATTSATIAAVRQALALGVPGLLGLHLEGPHLSLARKGAHDGDLIRPMTAADLAELVEAARALPALLLTVAPESVTLDQVRTLVAAGAVVSLGHSDTDYDTAWAYFEAGARCATHLFNAMSGLASRAPGLVGAALDHPAVWAGVIADAVHVHPATLRLAWRAKAGQAGDGGLFLVSDAMAVAGTDQRAFQLDGRQITRSAGRLTLADGTLAGADLDLTTALRIMHQEVGLPLHAALHAGTAAPAALLRCGDGVGRLAVGATCDLIRIRADLSHAAPVCTTPDARPDTSLSLKPEGGAHA